MFEDKIDITSSQGDTLMQRETPLPPVLSAAWARVTKVYALKKEHENTRLNNMLLEQVATFDQIGSSLRTLDSVIETTRMQYEPLKPRPECSGVCSSVCSITHPWLWCSNPTNSFGGNNVDQALKSFTKITFKDGFCYLNLFTELSFHIKPRNHEPFSRFLLDLPEKLGAYPPLNTISLIALHMLKLFPEIISSPVPAFAASHDDGLIHIVDCRGVPNLWHILNIRCFHDVASFNSMYDGNDVLGFSVGAAKGKEVFGKRSYNNWTPAHTKLAVGITRAVSDTAAALGGNFMMARMMRGPTAPRQSSSSSPSSRSFFNRGSGRRVGHR